MIDHFAQFDAALRLLNGRLALAGSPRFRLVVCGGSALVATGLYERTTRDVDIVALADDSGRLVDPAPLPAEIERAAREVADDLQLPRHGSPGSGSHGRRVAGGDRLVALARSFGRVPRERQNVPEGVWL